MSELALRVDGLGKEYKLTASAPQYQTLRDRIVSMIKAPMRRRGNVEATRFWALEEVSFRVNQGEIIGVVGRNGAGKSTLLKILSRITPPSRGSIEIYGRVGSLLEVGTGFHPELSGRENIFLNGAILGMRRAEIRRNLEAIVAFAEVERFIDTPVKHYSSGMYLRLAFAVAAHLDPEIMLVDEVLAVGDAAFQRKCLGKMSDVARQGRTVLLVSHNLAAVAALTQRTLVFHQGKLSEDGNTQAVLRRYVAASSQTMFSIEQDSKYATLHRITVDSPGETSIPGAGAVIAFGDPLSCSFDITVKEPLARAAFYIRVTDLYDNVIYTGMSYDGGSWNRLDLGPVRGVHSVELPLAPGSYSLTFGIVDQTRKPVCRFERVLSFQVLFPEWDFDNRPGTMVVRGNWTIGS